MKEIQQLREKSFSNEIIDNFNKLNNEEKNEIFQYIFNLKNDNAFDVRVNFFLNPLVKFDITSFVVDTLLTFTYSSEHRSQIIIESIISNDIFLSKEEVIKIMGSSYINSYLTEKFYEWVKNKHDFVEILDVLNHNNNKKLGFLYKDMFSNTKDAEDIYLPLLLKKGIKPSYIITESYLNCDNKKSLNMICDKLFTHINEHQLIAIGLALLNKGSLNNVLNFNEKYPIINFLKEKCNFIAPISETGIHHKLLRYLGSNIQEDTFEYLLNLNLNSRLINNLLHITLCANHKPYFSTLIRNIHNVESSSFIFIMFKSTVQNKKYQTSSSNYFMNMCDNIKNNEKIKNIIDCLDYHTYNNKDIVINNLCSEYRISHEKFTHPFFIDLKKVLLNRLLENELTNNNKLNTKYKI